MLVERQRREVLRKRIQIRDIAMEASVSSSSSVLSITRPKTLSRGYGPESKATVHFTLRKSCDSLVKNAIRTRRTRIAAINDVQTVLDPAPVQITWQIVVGAMAGVTPFVVAGVEFSKRIIAQKRCEVCGGSGLVLREKEYFRCPECGSPFMVLNNHVYNCDIYWYVTVCCEMYVTYGASGGV